CGISTHDCRASRTTRRAWPGCPRPRWAGYTRQSTTERLAGVRPRPPAHQRGYFCELRYVRKNFILTNNGTTSTTWGIVRCYPDVDFLSCLRAGKFATNRMPSKLLLTVLLVMVVFFHQKWRRHPVRTRQCRCC